MTWPRFIFEFEQWQTGWRLQGPANTAALSASVCVSVARWGTMTVALVRSVTISLNGKRSQSHALPVVGLCEAEPTGSRIKLTKPDYRNVPRQPPGPGANRKTEPVERNSCDTTHEYVKSLAVQAVFQMSDLIFSVGLRIVGGERETAQSPQLVVGLFVNAEGIRDMVWGRET